MNINHALLNKLCALACLDLQETERKSLLKSLNQLLHDFSKIQEVDSIPEQLEMK